MVLINFIVGSIPTNSICWPAEQINLEEIIIKKSKVLLSVMLASVLLGSGANLSNMVGLNSPMQTTEVKADPAAGDYVANPYALKYYRWSSPNITYKIDSSKRAMTSAQLSSIQSAISELQSKTPFRFTRNDNSTTGIVFSNVSSSKIQGNVAATTVDYDYHTYYLKRSDVLLNSSMSESGTKSVIEHEIGHALGLSHNGADTLMAHNGLEGKGAVLSNDDIQAFKLAATLKPGVYKNASTPTPNTYRVSPDKTQRVVMYQDMWGIISSHDDMTAGVNVEQNYAGAIFHPTARIIRPDGTTVFKLPNGRYVPDYEYDSDDGSRYFNAHSVVLNTGNANNIPLTDLRDGHSSQGVIQPNTVTIRNIANDVYNAPNGSSRVNTLANGSSWAVGGIKKVNDHYWYAVASNQWILADSQFNFATFNTAKTVKTVRQAKLYKLDNKGNVTAGTRALGANTGWATTGIESKNGQLMYKVSTDEYVLSSDVTVY